MVPGLRKGFAVLHADVKYLDRGARFARQHYRTRFRDVPRAAGTVNGERAILTLCNPPRHHGQPAQSAARRTPLRRAKPQPLDYFARPLPSKAVVFITTMPMSRAHHEIGMITRCQNA